MVKQIVARAPAPRPEVAAWAQNVADETWRASQAQHGDAASSTAAPTSQQPPQNPGDGGSGNHPSPTSTAAAATDHVPATEPERATQARPGDAPGSTGTTTNVVDPTPSITVTAASEASESENGQATAAQPEHGTTTEQPPQEPSNEENDGREDQQRRIRTRSIDSPDPQSPPGLTPDSGSPAPSERGPRTPKPWETVDEAALPNDANRDQETRR